MSDPDTGVTRRANWSEQFDAAYRFMFEAILSYPVAECGESPVSLQQPAQAADVSVAFSNKPHVQSLPRLYLLRDGQIPGFIGAATEMNERGWLLRAGDGRRPKWVRRLRWRRLWGTASRQATAQDRSTRKILRPCT